MHHSLATRIDGGQRDLLRRLNQIQKAQQVHCPSVFTITSTRKRIGKTTHTLRLYCEEPDAWHLLPGDTGCYEVTELDDWLRKAGPLNRTLRLLRATIPYAGPILGIAADELHKRLDNDIALATQILNDARPDLDNSDLAGAIRSGTAGPVTHANTDADFRSLRHAGSTRPNYHLGRAQLHHHP